MRAAAGSEVPERLEYQPALDGLRALAVIAVMVFHNGQGVGFGRGGFLGVDIFFVLSGFLITSLLLIDHAHKGRVVSGRFWARRARRLLPALFLLLVIQAVIAIWLADPWELNTIRDGSLATLFYVNNYWVLASHQSAQHLVLGHTWSLAIEEQFYLVWPLLLAGILFLARGRRAIALVIITVLIVVSTGLMFWEFDAKNPFPAYTRLDTRAHGLLVGAVLAFLLLERKPLQRRGARIVLEIVGIAALAGLAVLAVSTDFFRAHWLFEGGYLAIAIATALLITAAVQPSSPVLGRALSWKPLVAIGLISYGLYLFHLPVFKVVDAARTGRHGFSLFAVRMVVVFAIAVASYFLVERPVRRGAITRTQLVALAPVAAMLVVGGVVLANANSHPITPDAVARLSYERMAAAVPSGSTRVLVAGNDATSFGLGTMPGGRYDDGDGFFGTTVSIYGCSIVSGVEIPEQRASCDRWPEIYRDAADTFEPDVTVLVVGASEVFDRVVDGRKLVVGTPAFERYMLGQLEQARRVLTPNGTPLMVLTTPCGTDPVHAQWVNEVLRRFAADHAGSVRLGDYGEYVCPGGVMRTTVAGEPLYLANGVSLTPYGVLATWKWLAAEPGIRGAG